MSAQPAENLAADPAWENITKFPHPRAEVPNPILEAQPEAYQPPPDAVLNRPEPKPKRQRKAKATGKKPGRPPRAKVPEKDNGFVEPAQPLVATPPHGSARPNIRFSRVNVDTLILVFIGFGLFVAGGATAYFMTGFGQ